MKLGIGTYAFMWSIGFPGAAPRKPMSAFDLLEKARELNVKVVQYGPNLPLDSLPAEDLEALIAQARAWGIAIEIGTQGLEVGRLQGQLALAKQVGAELLRTTTEGPDGVTPPLEQMKMSIREVLPDLVRQSVFLAVENGRLPARKLAELVSSARSDHVGVTLDTANSFAVPEGTEQVAEVLAPYVKSLHLKDFVVERLWHRMGFSIHGKPAGSGLLDVPHILGMLRKAHPSPNAILELWPLEQGSLEDTIHLENAWAVESISYLRRYISA